ncbi:hypothetical protein EYC59_05545 [Candidatus Saccharibacteria bacterium]|nr:MAG: hypothetical protein EYC59_05545 [Candidatus Saccharibacteria bacterium]
MAKNTPQSRQATPIKRIYLWSLIALLVVTGTAVAILSLRNTSSKKVDTFQACKDAGGIIRESYPETCSYKGTSFVNEAQALSNPDSYVGLPEADAINQAKRGNKQYRVVERDGQSLPADMSIVQGRLNFYVSGGAVTKVVIEGQ